MRWAERLFDAFMYPLEAVSLARRRRFRMPAVSGVVLEIGAGTGANLPHYDLSKVEELHLSDLSLTRSVQDSARTTGARVFYHEIDVQDLPFPDHTFDTVVFTLVFCSVPDPVKGLAEVRRVLKSEGRLIFMEHVKPHAGMLRHAVDVLNPAWRSLNGECNINRDTLSTIQAAGFLLSDVHEAGRGLIVDGVARPV